MTLGRMLKAIPACLTWYDDDDEDVYSVRLCELAASPLTCTLLVFFLEVRVCSPTCAGLCRL